VIAKLEKKPQALKKLEEIFEVCGRGDGGARRFGRGNAAEKVPVIQKYVIAGCETGAAGDHRHPDAGIDDRKCRVHTGGGQRMWATRCSTGPTR